MKRLLPFALAILGITFAVSIMFLVTRNESLRAKLRVTDLIEEEGTE